ncbi:hypothetical protein [Pelodictyon phaeoclathratiforme]|uniref:hypothetical protein n=1 Tax=Pelodictyon phaeoclathratiforme TaxID=34090 RepID=UPI001232EFE0|nr:hypothetical protein [Pelodictyon phaeoclathratiforme]MBV5288632.1 hypothetical protein [Pelodictyon phaeoclathratiforme]
MQPVHSRTTHSVNGIPLPLYLLVSFGGAWLIWLPLLIAEYLQLSLLVPSVVFITLGSFAPSFADNAFVHPDHVGISRLWREPVTGHALSCCCQYLVRRLEDQP